MFGWEWKCEGMKKVSLYKFTNILLLQNDAQLKQKSDQQPKNNNNNNKSNHPNLFKKKIMFRKKKNHI